MNHLMAKAFFIALYMHYMMDRTKTISVLTAAQQHSATVLCMST